jgi:hypothetical protein
MADDAVPAVVFRDKRGLFHEAVTTIPVPELLAMYRETLRMMAAVLRGDPVATRNAQTVMQVAKSQHKARGRAVISAWLMREALHELRQQQAPTYQAAPAPAPEASSPKVERPAPVAPGVSACGHPDDIRCERCVAPAAAEEAA